jgi:hypothetical protein
VREERERGERERETERKREREKKREKKREREREREKVVSLVHATFRSCFQRIIRFGNGIHIT